MKHVCVAARIGEGKAPGEGNSHSIAKTSNAASRGGRSRFQALCAWMRPRSATRSAPNPRDSRAPPRSHPRKRGASEGGRGTPWDLTPQTRMGSAIRAHDRLHGRIPIDGAPAPRCADPCSTLRCAADSGCNPSGWHEFSLVAPGSRRKDFVFGAETGAVRRIGFPEATSPFPQTGLRLTSHGAAVLKVPCLG
jgi:hypothetical protein